MLPKTIMMMIILTYDEKKADLIKVRVILWVKITSELQDQHKNDNGHSGHHHS